ncbi:TonB-dependent receptor [Hymenobacter mucosus]|uniref:Iron complex outermembrane recepter protein n=1 Tax=Hymenobacter mucosus TaxID=1411120 RepID=A0A238XLS2_9BACT|nr:TonB-dependent receptor [Hymenobacter mucosus]SNR59531.1 iron complex outermembrane recepter protein [Hymenobacter mucosus]
MSRRLPLLVLLSSFSAATPLFAATPALGSPVVAHGDDETAQRGRIAGRVLDTEGKPVEGVTVALKGTPYGATTATDGSFRVSAPAGAYQLVVSSIGYTTQEVAVTITGGETTTLAAFGLVGSSQSLSGVTVTGTKSLNQRPTTISKLPVASLDLPQSAVTVEREVLEQQQVLRLSDALVNVSGLYVTSTTGGTQEELGSRGFAYGSNNTFKNGVRFNNGVMPEASSLERMEVLKGSAAILYGNVAAGGVLNLVTKKPRFEQGGSVALRVGSFGFWKPMVDVYGAVGKSENVAFRLNGTYEQGNSYRDEVKSDRVYVNPSLLFNLTPKTTLVVEGDYLRDNRTPDYGVGAIDYNVLESRSRFLNTPGAKNATTQTSTTATLSSRLNDTWQIRGVAGFQRYDNELRTGNRPVGINNGTMPEVKRGNTVIAKAHPKASLYGDWQRTLSRTQTRENYYLAQLDLTGQFQTGFLGHTLLIGADADQYQTNALTHVAQAYDSINVLNRGKVLNAPANRVNSYEDLRRNTRTLGNTRRAGFYVQDLLSISEKIKVLAGVRWSYQETPSDVYTYAAPNASGVVVATVKENRRFDDAFSPRLGIVYQPIKTTSLFASYSNSFTPNTGVDVNNTNLPPSIIDQYEVGIKNELFKGALSANVTAYRIVNSNQAQSIQQFLPGSTVQNPAWSASFTAQELAGEVTSKGVEVDIQSKPMYGLSFIAGYSYNNTAYTKSNIYENGSRLRYNPAHTANLSLFYNFGSAFGENGFLRGFTAGFTTYYVGDKVAGRNPRQQYNKDGQLIPETYKLISIPNYLQLDASLGYTYERFSVRVKIANLLNELSYNMHDDNSVNPIAPRNFSATASYRL